MGTTEIKSVVKQLDREAAAVELDHGRAKYAVGEVVAQGGMGALIEATDQNIRRNVAMKAMELMIEASEQELARVNRSRLAANAWVESAGFYESVRELGPREQLERLRALVVKPHPKGYDPKYRFETSNDTIVSRDFSQTNQQLLQPLQGFPLQALDISRTRVASLEPLDGMPLERLTLPKPGELTTETKAMIEGFRQGTCQVTWR
jgi:hypothetical protein